MKQLLCLLVITSLIFYSCEKDDDKDYRDIFEGTYSTDILGVLSFINADGETLPFETIDAKADIVVNKMGGNQLMLIFGREYMTVTIDEDGDFNIPPESFSEDFTDPDTGMEATMNITISITGSITNKKLYIKETYSGDALIELNGVKERLDIAGAIVYNGQKK